MENKTREKAQIGKKENALHPRGDNFKGSRKYEYTQAEMNDLLDGIYSNCVKSHERFW